uniref:glutathione S-transferase 1-like n=1 Tax=Styela clava TaxID=7725 RepID=UPI001939A0B0|nr:glutathione S-transferase 1-like [Styela clava]XP_039256417.1 glutathione S-transferase 1-like [Styela clava]XP_039256418.1 glutathione S-transferase 1-like [Styela clava]
MEFYYHPFSSPCMGVWFTLNQLGVNFELKFVDLITEVDQRKEEFLKMNPLGKVPVLKDGDFCLNESHAIAQYLCLKYEADDTAQKLYPKDLQNQAKVNSLMYLESDCLSKIYNYVNLTLWARDQPPRKDRLNDVYSSLNSLETILERSKFLANEHPTLPDLFAIATVNLLDVAKFNDYQKYPNLVAWKQRMQQLPHYEESVGKHIPAITDFFQSKAYLNLPKNDYWGIK